jgi:probable rRNA maturation factor
MSFTIVSQSKISLPRLPFRQISQEILGPDYDLGLVFSLPGTMRQLNLKHRKKDKVSNILSFPYSESHGEIFICPAEVRKQLPDFGVDFQTLLLRLFIHGLLHLKGMTHSSKMDKRERQLVKRFSLS